MRGEEKVNFRVTSRTSDIADSLVSSRETMPTTRLELFETAVEVKCMERLKEFEGLKNILDFINHSSQDIEWLNIEVDTGVNSRLLTNQQFKSTPETIYVPDETDRTLNQAARYAQMDKSDIIRLCIIDYMDDIVTKKQTSLESVTVRKVQGRWSDLSEKLTNLFADVVESLYHEVCNDYINEMCRQQYNLSGTNTMLEHYDRFKNTSGYDRMMKLDRGKEIAHTLEVIKEDTTPYIEEIESMDIPDSRE